MIPIYIPSYNRAKNIKTTKWLDKSNLDYKVILHTDKCKDDYLKAGVVRKENIIVSNADKGITNQRNFIMNNLTIKNNWFITLDDNISGFKMVEPRFYFKKKKLDVNSKNITQKNYDTFITAKKFIELVNLDIELAEKINVTYGGFATVDNYFFNAKKYKSVGYVISKAAYIKYVGQSYDKNIKAMDDFGFTAQSLLMNNAVLINNWMKPINKHYEQGGIGTYTERLPKKINDANYLLQKYPGLFRYKQKKNTHPKAELQIRFNNPKQIKNWKKTYYEKN